MNWDEYFFKMCEFVSQKSKDLHTKAGCVIVDRDNCIRSTGYNGFPRGVRDKVEEVPERCERPEKYVWTEHAERNAIFAAAKMGVSLDGCKIYITGFPCFECARAIIQSGIEVVYIEKTDTDYIIKNNDKYRFDAAETMMKERSIELHAQVDINLLLLNHRLKQQNRL